MTTEQLQEMLGKVTAQYTEINAQLKDNATKALAEQEKYGKITDALKAQVDSLLNSNNSLKADMDALFQRISKAGAGESAANKSLGQLFVEDESVKNFLASRGSQKTVSLQINAAITSLTTDADGSAGAAIRPDRQQGIIALPDRRMTIRDLLTPGTTTSNSIEYVKEVGFTNNAGIQANEGDQKGESSLQFELVVQSVATIAHFIRASKQVLDDAAMLQSHIDYRLRYGLAYVEELQLLNGSGTGGNINGLITQANTYVAPDGLGTSSMIDQLRLAILQAELAEYPANGIVLHPTDWASIELHKDGQGQYIIANPVGRIAPLLWRLPVVSTQAITRDKFLVGAFMLGAQIFDRQQATVELSTEDRDNFVKNMVTIRAEERLALAVYRPEAFVYGDFGNVA